MTMTHYMELLATNQPWNLLFFMIIPVVLAEAVAVSELYVLFTRNTTGMVSQINKIAGILAGVYFTGVFFYLVKTVVIPLSQNNLWRGPADIIAVGAYLLGVVPLAGIALLDLRILFKEKIQEDRLKLHAYFVGVFLVVVHVAMIFGMMNPEILGYTPTGMMSM